MRLIKYDGISDKSVKTILGSSGGGSSSNNTDTPSRGDSGSLERTIWGQNDVGDDIDGSMTVNGNVSIKCITPPSYEDDDSDDGENEETEEGGGNLDVELKITSKEVEANDIYAKEHLYIPHPTTKAKTDIVELLKGYDSRITNNTTNIAANKTEIDALKGRVGTAETNITNLTTKVNTNTTNIQNNTEEIEKLKQTITDIDLSEITETLNNIKYELKVAKYGNYAHPVVLLSGRIRKYNYTNASNTFVFEGCKSELITNLTIGVEGGTMTLTPTFADKTSYNISAIHVTQEMSGDTADNSTSTKTLHSSSVSINGRSDGAHWFEAYKDGANIKIREFHQRNADNDSWGNDYWGGDGGGIRAINITVIGYLFQME